MLRLKAFAPLRLRRYHTQLLGRTEPEAAVVLRRSEQNSQRHVRGISRAEKGLHQSAPDAGSLMIRKYANRPHGNNWVIGDRRVARRNVAGHPAVGQCREREFGNDVARRPQRLEQTDLRGDATRVLRRPKTGPPKSLRVDISNRLVIVDPLLSDDHRLILASHAQRRRPSREPAANRDSLAGG